MVAFVAAAIVAIIGLLVALVGVIGLASPEAFKAFASRFRSPAGMYTAIAIRLVVGILLYWGGAYCHPARPWVGWLVRLIGLLVFVAGLVMLVLGEARFKKTMDWVLGLPPAAQRVWSAVALVIGVFLFFAAV
jgi:hypothetical protein